MLSRKDVVKCLVDHLLQECCLSTRKNSDVTCKRLPLAHTTFASISGTFIQQTHLFHAALRPAHPSGFKNAPRKIPTWIYFRSQGLKDKYQIFLSFCFTLVTISTEPRQETRDGCVQLNWRRSEHGAPGGQRQLLTWETVSARSQPALSFAALSPLAIRLHTQLDTPAPTQINIRWS